MSGIGPGEISEGISNVYNLVISTESAQILANELNKKEWWQVIIAWAPVLTSLISLYIATISIKIAEKSSKISKNSLKISKNSFIDNITKLYFEIDSLNCDPIKKKIMLCNYFEYICDLFYKNKLKEKDFDIFCSIMEQQDFANYATTINETDYKSYSCYLMWLREKDLI